MLASQAGIAPVPTVVLSLLYPLRAVQVATPGAYRCVLEHLWEAPVEPCLSRVALRLAATGVHLTLALVRVAPGQAVLSAYARAPMQTLAALAVALMSQQVLVVSVAVM